MCQLSNIYSIIYSTLTQLGYTVREQGSFAPGAILPDTFVTYQIVNKPSISFADNRPTGYSARIQVALYSRDPVIKQDADNIIKAAMLPAGFLRIDGRDLPFDAGTGHHAYTVDYRYYEMEV